MRRFIVTVALLVGMLSLGMILSADGHGRHQIFSPPAVLAALLK